MPIFRWAYPIYILYFITSFLHYTLTKKEKKKEKGEWYGKDCPELRLLRLIARMLLNYT